MALTKLSKGLIGGGLVLIGAAGGVGANHLLNHKAAKPQAKEVIQVVVTPTASASATPTVFIAPTKAMYRYYQAPVVTKPVVK